MRNIAPLSVKRFALTAVLTVVLGFDEAPAQMQLGAGPPSSATKAASEGPPSSEPRKQQRLKSLGPFLDPDRSEPFDRKLIPSLKLNCPSNCAGGNHTFIYRPDDDAPGRLDRSGLHELWGGVGAPGGLQQPNPKIVGGKPADGAIDESASATLINRIAAALPIQIETPAPNDAQRRVVAIKYRDYGAASESLCTGFILDAKHVLTAGHCGCAPYDTYSIAIDDKTTNQNFTFVLEGPPQLLDQRVCRDHRLYGTDLALLTIKTQFTCLPSLRKNPAAKAIGPSNVADCRSGADQLTDKVFHTFGYPAALYLQMSPPLGANETLLAVGYGYTETHAIGSRMQGTIPIRSANCTEPQFKGICAPYAELVLSYTVGSDRHTDTCGGDSGGPIFRVSEGQYTLVGITSRAVPFAQIDPAIQCGGGGIYTIVGRETVHNWFRANGVQSETTVVATRTP